MIPHLKYYKRYRMERSIRTVPPAKPLSPCYSFVPWHERLCDIHGDIKFRAFVDDLDARVFPNLGSAAGCRDLMRAIRTQPGFCAPATWLIAGPEGYVGTVQGIMHRRCGAIQNLGVVPECRGLGLGEALLVRALQGFRSVGATRVELEVTAENRPAVTLYRKHGFRSVRAVYIPVLMAPLLEAGAGI